MPEEVKNRGRNRKKKIINDSLPNKKRSRDKSAGNVGTLRYIKSPK